MNRRKLTTLITIVIIALNTLLISCDNRSIYQKITSANIEDNQEEVIDSTEELAPEQCIGAYYDYIIRDDDSALINIGIDSKNVINISDRREKSKIELQKQFKGTGITFTNEQLDRMVNAEIKLLMKLKNYIEVEKIDDENAVLKLASTYVDIAKLSQLAAATSIAEVKSKNIHNSKEFYEVLPEYFISDLEKRLDSAVPSKIMKNLEANFKKATVYMDNKKFYVWKCENESDFATELLNLVITNP